VLLLTTRVVEFSFSLKIKIKPLTVIIIIITIHLYDNKHVPPSYFVHIFIDTYYYVTKYNNNIIPTTLDYTHTWYNSAYDYGLVNLCIVMVYAVGKDRFVGLLHDLHFVAYSLHYNYYNYYTCSLQTRRIEEHSWTDLTEIYAWINVIAEFVYIRLYIGI